MILEIIHNLIFEKEKMIKKIYIKNFKSIYKLELEVGRVNLFIGENGSGKSNLLESLVFVSASESNKLDNEFLVSRGLRVPEPDLMRSAFNEDDKNKDIFIKLEDDEYIREYLLRNDDIEYSSWKVDFDYRAKGERELSLSDLEVDIKKLDYYMKIQEKILDLILHEEDLKIKASEEYKKMKGNKINLSKKEDSINKLKDLMEKIQKISIEISMLKKEEENLDRDMSFLYNFIIYSPENSALRIFEKEKQIQPLGINGEGLLKLLKVINNYEDKSYIKTIIESLQLFDWFEDITIPSNISSIEDTVIIKDKYLYREFTQRSANEGFLFILFYITLIVAKETPKAFAIDNIDASLNPKLCTKLMIILTDLARKYDKQIFLTTHNPAILDGIDLNDEEQKLFVVSRNKQGHTRMKEITVESKPKSSDNEPLRLSEAFLRGYIGGLPKGF